MGVFVELLDVEGSGYSCMVRVGLRFLLVRGGICFYRCGVGVLGVSLRFSFSFVLGLVE